MTFIDKDGWEYREDLPPTTSKPQRTKSQTPGFYQQDGQQLFVHLLVDAPTGTRQFTPSHLLHLMNHHRAAIALAGHPYPPLCQTIVWL